MKNLKKINLQLFANIDDVISAGGEQFKDNPDFGTNFKAMAETLKGMGYDVLINKKDAAEFVPTTRLNEVVGQREQYKTQAANLQKQLEEMKVQANPEQQKQIDVLIENNKQLARQLEESSIKFECINVFKDAINPSDMYAFIDKSKITIDKDGKVHGMDTEYARLKAEKPYYFNKAEGGADNSGSGSSGGVDNSNTGGTCGTMDMNSLLRRAAGFR